MPTVLKFQRPDSGMTLADGLREYYASRDGLVDGRGVSEAAREFFRCHDAAHVVFGCSTTLTNEGIVKIWSFFGTTAGLGLIRDYGSPESKEIYEKLEWGPIVATALRMLVLAPRVWWRSRRMRRPWPWNRFEAYLEVPLVEIRTEYRIDVLTAP